MSSGDYGDVGVGGLATAGGIGFLGRKHGLTIDHVAAAELVLADGTFLRVDAENNPDLFWALRGAGGNYGIVTALELDAYPVGNVVYSRMVFEGSAELLERWAHTVEQSPRELTSFLTIVQRGRGLPTAQLATVYAGDDVEAATDALTPLLSAGPLLDQQAQLAPYPAIVAPQGGAHTGGSAAPAFRSGLLDHVTPEAAQAVMALLRSGDAPYLQIRAVGGAINDIDADATAYAHRHQNFAVSAVGTSLNLLNQVWDAQIGPHLDGLYVSFDTDQRPERLLDAFPEKTLDRLRALKAQYDPNNVFNQNFAIPPADVRYRAA
jgi:FAD/FMN-containing dehydrogenase